MPLPPPASDDDTQPLRRRTRPSTEEPGQFTPEASRLLDALGAGVVVHAERTGWPVLYCNAAASRLLGLPGGQLTGPSALVVTERLRQADGEPLSLDGYAARLMAPGGASGELLQVVGAGEPAWMRFTAAVGPATTAGVATRVVTLVDATAEQAASARLQVECYKLQVALDSNADGILIADTDGNVLHTNQAFARFNRFDGGQSPGAVDRYANWLEVRVPGAAADPEPFRAWPVSRALRGEVGAGLEIEVLRRATGETWLATCSYAPIRDRANQILGAVIVVRDITDVRRTATALAHSEQNFRQLVEGSEDGIFVMDTDSRLRYVNRAFVGMLGAESQDALIGTLLQECVAPEYREGLVERVVQAMNSGRPSERVRLDFIRKDGTTLPTERSAAVLAPDQMIVIVRDISARLASETDRERLHGRLLQAAKMESIGRLAGSVAHDFSNILQAQRLFCALLGRKLQPDSDMADDLAQIEACAERGTALTRHLLTFSRKLPGKVEVLDLNEMLEGMISFLRRLVGEDVTLTLETPAQALLVRVDQAQIEQVILNLLVNARDAVQPGGHVVLSVARVDELPCEAQVETSVAPGPFVRLSAIDDGCGMDDVTQRQVFEPFFTTKPHGRGTGLGLATVYGIVMQNCGAIALASAPGAGTRFDIYLPLTADMPPAKHPGPAFRKRAGAAVMLVEDDTTLREGLTRLLEDQGHHVVAAPDAAAALLQVHQLGIRPELLLTDIILPQLSGSVLAKRLRATLGDIPVVFMSGFPDLVETPAADVFLLKPFSSNELLHAIDAALERGKPRRPRKSRSARADPKSPDRQGTLAP